MDMYIRNLKNMFQVSAYSVEAMILWYLRRTENLQGIDLNGMHTAIQLTALLDVTSYEEFMCTLNTHKQLVNKNRIMVDENSYNDVVNNRMEINLGLIDEDRALIAYVDDKTWDIWDFKIEEGHADEFRDKQLYDKIQRMKLKYSLAGKKCSIHLIGDKLFEIAYGVSKNINITTEHTGFLCVCSSSYPRYSTPTVFTKLKFVYGIEFRVNKVYVECSIHEAAKEIGIDFGDLLGIRHSILMNGVYNVDSAVTIRLRAIKSSLVRVDLAEELHIDCIENSILELGEIVNIDLLIATDVTFIVRSDINFESLNVLKYMLSPAYVKKGTLKFIIKYVEQSESKDNVIGGLIAIYGSSTVYVPSEINKSRFEDRENVVWYDSRNYDQLLKEIGEEYGLW